MDKLVIYKDNNEITKNIINNGKKVLEENIFFKELDDMMTDKKFRSFYDKYFNDYSDIKISILYMKLYETIQKEYFDINNHEIEKELLAYMIKELMSNKESLKKIISSFNDFENNRDKSILNIFNGLGEIKNKFIM